MRSASAAEIKSALKELSAASLNELLLRLSRYKKENKELLTYLLFEADNMPAYINAAREEIEEEFEGMNKSNIHLAKKSIRRILRNTNKYIRHTGSKEAEIELLSHFCKALKNSGINLKKSTALQNLYAAQVKKIRVAIATLHEDLQHDYLRLLATLD